MMRFLALGLCLLPFLAAGCRKDPLSVPSVEEARTLGFEQRDEETLRSVYPPGTPRAEVRARESEALVFSIHACNFDLATKDVSLAASLERFRLRHPEAEPRCDIVRLGRTGWTTLIGGLALYQDYVYYDAQDQVLVAYRAFLSRSGRED